MPQREIAGIVETRPLAEAEKEKLEDAYQEYLSIVQAATAAEKLILTAPAILNVIVGLVPETILTHGMFDLELVKQIFQKEALRHRFAFLKMVNRQPLSLINLDRAKEVFQREGQSAEEFIAWLVEAFATAPNDREREILYGLLSGFPLSAVWSFSEAVAASGQDNNGILYRLAAENDFLPPPGQAHRQPVAPDWQVVVEANYSQPEMPHVTYFPHPKIPLPPNAVEGLPSFRFRLAKGGEKDPQLQKLYSRFNFVYYTLGAMETL